MKNDYVGEYAHVIPTLCCLAAAGISAWFRSPQIPRPLVLEGVSDSILAVLPFAIAFLAARSYVHRGSRIFLLFGCGMLAIGLGDIVSIWGLPKYGANFTSTLFDSSMLLSSVYHLSGVALLTFGSTANVRSSKRSAVLTCVAVYLGAALALLLISFLAIKGAFLIFLDQRQGPTMSRQVVMTLAGMAYAISAVLLVSLHGRTRMRFLSLYSNGLFLTGLGILTLLSPIPFDSLLSWVGTISRYFADFYFLAAIMAGIWETRIHGTTLPEYLSELFRLHLDDQVKVRTKALAETNKKLELSRLEMRNLATNLLRVREEERRKIAQELHDEFGQTLIALKMDLHWVAKHLGGDTASLREKIAGTIELGEQAISTVRRLASDLRPRMLDDLGLEAALDWLCTDFMRRTKITCKVTTDIPQGMVGKNAATVLYRFTQEALANIGRHSRADHAAVHAFVGDGMLNLQIEDDGIGITAQKAAAPDSYGLIGLRESVVELGGDLSIRGEPGSGTVLLARVPVPEEGKLS